MALFDGLEAELIDEVTGARHSRRRLASMGALAGLVSTTGGNSRETFTPSEDGTYYLAAGAYGNDQGTYTLAVEEIVDGI